MAHVVVYTAPGCHLCGPALDVVESVCGRGFEVVDITANGDLERRYRTRIPVVEVDGVERCRYVVDEDELRAFVETRYGLTAGPSGPFRSGSWVRRDRLVGCRCGIVWSSVGRVPGTAKRLGPTFVRPPSFASRFKAIRICSTLTVSPRSENASTTRTGVIG